MCTLAFEIGIKGSDNRLFLVYDITNLEILLSDEYFLPDLVAFWFGVFDRDIQLFARERVVVPFNTILDLTAKIGRGVAEKTECVLDHETKKRGRVTAFYQVWTKA